VTTNAGFFFIDCATHDIDPSAHTENEFLSYKMDNVNFDEKDLMEDDPPDPPLK
jgi:hypothetical protein